MNSELFVVLSARGSTWGIPGRQVYGVEQKDGVVRLLLTRGSAAADEVFAVDQRLRVFPVPAPLRRRWPVPCHGLSMWGSQPVVLVDGTHLPGFCGEES